jgi:hypothetical protein
MDRAILIPVGLALCVLLLAGCPQSPAIGGACDPGVSSADDNREITMTSPALECEGGICLQLGAAAALCTAECGSDDDCRNIATSTQCRSGFACGVASPFGTLGCHRVCLCRGTPAPPVSCPATP